MDTVRREPRISLEEYVEHELEMTRRLVERGASNTLEKGKDRFDRAREYAHWRYAAYCAREIGSL
jgi:hypothetical protein